MRSVKLAVRGSTGRAVSSTAGSLTTCFLSSSEFLQVLTWKCSHGGYALGGSKWVNSFRRWLRNDPNYRTCSRVSRQGSQDTHREEREVWRQRGQPSACVLSS